MPFATKSPILSSSVSLPFHLDFRNINRDVQLNVALQTVELRVHEGVPVSRNIIYHLLQACTKQKDLAAGRRVHSLMISSGLDSVSILRDHLIRLFAICGSLVEAIQTFCKVTRASVYTWNAVIAAHVMLGERQKAPELYHRMLLENVIPDRVTFLCILKACANMGVTCQGRLIHDQIIRSGYESDLTVGNTLIYMYNKCDNSMDAWQIFNNLPNRDVVSWDVMISGYVDLGDCISAFDLFQKMSQNGINPDRVTFLCILKACTYTEFAGQGKVIHDWIIKNAFDSDLIIGNALVDLYAKCGSLEEACKTFEKIPGPDVVSWGTILAGFVQNGHYFLALEGLKKMQEGSILPSKVTYLCSLKACGRLGDISQGRLIHYQIVLSGLELDELVGSTLLDMYCKCGSLADASRLFEKLSKQDVVSWGVMIAGYVQQGYGHSAIETFEKMQQEGMEANGAIFLCILKACGSVGATGQGRLIHDQIIKSGVESDVVIGSTLVDMYAKCGSLEVAREVFDRMSNRNLVSWSAMIAGYVHHGQGGCALELFDNMQQEGMKPNNVVFPSILKAFGMVRDLEFGKQMHDLVCGLGLESDLVVGNSLIDMYAKCGALEEALVVFDWLPNRNAISYGAIIVGYVQQGNPSSAVELFKEMQLDAIKPNNIMLSSILKACGILGRLEQGKLIHEHIVKSEIGPDVVIASSLIDMYAKSGSLKEASKLFDELQIPNVVSWGAMISGYVQHGQPLHALKLFAELLKQGVNPNRIILPCILKACVMTGEFQHGKLVHDEIMRIGLETDVVVASSMVDMYTKCGSLDEAHKLFDKMPDRDVVLWGAMIIGYVQQGHDLPALQLFEDMQHQGIKPNEMMFPCILKACGSSGALLHGKLIHNDIIRSGFELCSVIGNNLINLYSSCGSLEDARRVFEELPCQDVVSWGALIVGYAQQGNYRLVRQCLEVMQRQGLKPDGGIYVSALSACSHAGLVEEGRSHFKSMSQGHGIITSIEHVNCMVDLLGRAGYLEEAKHVLQIMPVLPDIVGWTTLLTACRTYCNKELGRECFDQVALFDHDVRGSNVFMSSFYSDVVLWEEVNMEQELDVFAGSWKKPGMAWIEVDTKVHEFIVGDRTHQNSSTIDFSLKRFKGLIKEKGYVPQVGVVFEGKKKFFYGFSEISHSL